MPLDSRDPDFVFYPQESFNGAVARWAADAWIERMLDVTSVAGVEWGHRQTAAAADEVGIRKLAAEMNVDADELLYRSMPAVGERVGYRGLTRFYGLTLPVTLLEKRQRRFAPAALRTAPYHRALWDLRLLPACVETGQVLIDRCGNIECSGKALGWRHTMGIDRCEHCMADLAKSETLVLEPHLQQALQPVAQLFQPEERQAVLAKLPPAIAAQEGQVAVDLLARLLPVVDPALSSFLNGLHRADPIALATAVAKAWKILRDWPHSFEELAATRVNGRKTTHQDGNAGETIRFLKSSELPSTPTTIAHLASGIREKLDVSGPNGGEVLRKFLSVKAASKALAIGTAEAARFRREGALSTKLVFDEQRRLQPMFDRDEVNTIAGDIGRRIGLDSLSWELGISRNGAEQIVGVGLLDLLVHPFFEARYGIPQVTAASHQRFRDRLDHAAKAEIGDDTIALTLAIKIIGGRLKPWGPLFGALANGVIPFRLEPDDRPLTRRLFVRRRDLPTIENLHFIAPAAPVISHAKLISKADAMEILNISPKEGTSVLADVSADRGGRSKVLAVEDVLEMARRHITSAELSLRRDVGLRRAYLDAIEQGVPRLGPAGFCRRTANSTFFE